MNADGTGLVQLTDNPANDMDPSWSPDGGRIAFSSDRDGDGEVYTIHPDGTGLVKLTDNGTWDSGPGWSRR